jgi:hypothetical protein
MIFAELWLLPATLALAWLVMQNTGSVTVVVIFLIGRLVHTDIEAIPDIVEGHFAIAVDRTPHHICIGSETASSAFVWQVIHTFAIAINIGWEAAAVHLLFLGTIFWNAPLPAFFLSLRVAGVLLLRTGLVLRVAVTVTFFRCVLIAGSVALDSDAYAFAVTHLH